MSCLDENTVLRLFAGTLPGERLREVERHLDGCHDCLDLVALGGPGAPESPAPAATTTRPLVTFVGPGSTPGLFTHAPWGDAPPPGERLPELAPGNTLVRGRFTILRKLGQGAMGTVHAARDGERQAEVALKTMLRADEAAVHRMKHEFRAIADVVHPHLVTLHELFFDEDRCFFTMDLVRGRPFLEATREPAALRRALRQLVAGVEAIHRAGKLHRDLKPSNVLVSDRGEVAILDFGLVRDLAPGAGAGALERGICGTPHYMSPEQAAGRPAAPASDWYSVGVMLYESLTGRLPFLGTPLEVMTAKQVYPAPPPETLVDGLPSDLVGLCNRLLAFDPRDRPRSTEILALLGERPTIVAPAVAAPEHLLVGRAAPLAQLHAALQAVRLEHRAAWVSLTGQPGYGKTALLETFRSEVAGGERPSLVLMGRCYERESVPFKALDGIAEALARHLAALSPRALARLAPPDVWALAQLFPALRALPWGDGEAAAPGVPADGRQLRRRASQAFAALVTRLGEEAPVVMIIDDLQWGDVDSAWLLLDLLRGSGDGGRAARLLLVTACRTDEAAASPAVQHLRQHQATVAEGVEIQPLTVDRLGPADAHALATFLLRRGGALGAAPVEVVCREAEGSPLLIAELAEHARDLEARGLTLAPDARLSLGDLVRARLDRFRADARALFDVVCVSGRPISQRVACLAAAVPDGEGDALVRALRGARLLRIRTSHSAGALDVAHDRIRELALGELPGERLRLLHRALAAAYSAAAPDSPEPLAVHFAGAGDPEKAARFAERAGEVAEAALAFDRAAQMFRLALDLDPGAPEHQRALTARLARALSDARRGGEAAPLYLQAGEGAPPAEALALKLRAAEQWLVSGRTGEGMAIYRQVLGAVGLALPETPRAALMDLLLTRARIRLRPRGIRVVPRPETEVPPGEVLRLDACKGAWPLSFVNTIQGAALQAKYLWLALQAREPYRMALGLGMEAIYRSAEGGGEKARVAALQAAAEALVASVDNPHARAFLMVVEGHVSYLGGQWQRTSAACERAEEILLERCRNVTWELNANRYFWANSLVYQGRWREVGARLEGWLRDAEERSDFYAWSGLKLVRTVSSTLAAGEVKAARLEVDQALERWGTRTFGVQSFLAAISLAQLHLYEGDPAMALGRLERMWPSFSRSLMTRIHVCRVAAFQQDAYITLALLASDAGERAGRLRARALAGARKLRREGMLWSDAYAEYIEAAAAHLDGDDGAAIRRLERSADLFTRAHMSLFAAATRRRLGALLGGGRGRELVDAADAVFRRQGIAQHQRLAAMMAPGFRAGR